MLGGAIARSARAERDGAGKPLTIAGSVSAASVIELSAFDQVEAAPGTALLRVAAHVAVDDGETLPEPVLIVDDGAEVHRMARLPAPPDPAGVLRVAYSVPRS